MGGAAPGKKEQLQQAAAKAGSAAPQWADDLETEIQAN